MCGSVQDPRAIPATLGAHQNIRINSQPDGLRVWLRIENNLEVGVVRKEKLGTALERLPSHVDIVVEQVLLRPAIDSAVALHAAQLHARLHQFGAEFPATKLVA